MKINFGKCKLIETHLATVESCIQHRNWNCPKKSAASFRYAVFVDSCCKISYGGYKLYDCWMMSSSTILMRCRSYVKLSRRSETQAGDIYGIFSKYYFQFRFQRISRRKQEIQIIKSKFQLSLELCKRFYLFSMSLLPSSKCLD